MDGKLLLGALFLLCTILRITLGKLIPLHRKVSNSHTTSKLNFNKYNGLSQVTEELSDQTIMFHVEEALLKSNKLFPYFMLVAFEAGGPLRALILLLTYPFVCLVGKELGMKIMVFVCFFGIKEESFQVGRTVLPKFFLEDVGYEGFDMVKRYKRQVGVSDLPRVMIDGFLKDYLGVENVVGRELKVGSGYFSGLMDARKRNSDVVNEVLGEEKTSSLVFFGCSNEYLDQQVFSHCKEMYMVSEAEKSNWQILPREKYPKPLIFHDGRLAFRPTPLAALVMFIWFPFGSIIFLIRFFAHMGIPYKMCNPILSFTGYKITLTRPKSYSTLINNEKKHRCVLYACNHKTLLDPIHISYMIMKPLTAVVYSLSRATQLVSPIKTISLTRDRKKDSKTMDELLKKGDLLVCPEGTTCREPYLLRFSPLFAEISDDIVPVAIDMQVSMFYGTTAGGFKWLDPVYLLMNPSLNCSIKILEKLPAAYTCGAGGKSKFEVANYVQKQIADALGFECTNLTRKDKYMILVGNEGTSTKKKKKRGHLGRPRLLA